MAVLGRTPTVSVLATSREGLGVGGEHLCPVASLEVNGEGGGSAVELFVGAAPQAVRPAFSLDDETDRAAVTEICRRLDGIPLAIEWAAARMMSMNPSEMVERLSTVPSAGRSTAQPGAASDVAARRGVVRTSC